MRRPCERRDPYVDGPRAARVFDGLIGSLASICPAYLVRLVRPLAKMVFRDASSKQPRDLYRPMGPTDFLAPGSIDPTICLLLQLRLNRLAT